MKRTLFRRSRVAATMTLAVFALGCEEQQGRLLASNCAQCHGTDGHSQGGIDSLAGMAFAELYDELRDMKADPDTGNIMHLQASGYTDEQMRQIATFYSQVRSNP